MLLPFFQSENISEIDISYTCAIISVIGGTILSKKLLILSKSLSIVTVAFVAVVLILPKSTYSATTSKNTSSSAVSDLLKKRETLSREIERNKKQAEEKRKETLKISGEIKKIDGDIATTEKRISQTEEAITTTQTDIEKITSDIAAQENDLARETSNQKEAIMVLYETTEQNYILLLFTNNINEAIDKASYLEALEVRIESTIEEITQLKNELIGQKEALIMKKQELEGLKKQQEAYRKGLDYQKSKKQELLVDAKEAQADYEKRIEEARKAYQDVNSELYRLTEAARKKAKTGSKKVGTRTYGWPFSGAITAIFGEPTPIQSFHTGIDIDGVIGDPISAAADGTVSFVGGNSRYGYGLYVTIDHGDGVSTLYGHLSGFDVDSGQEVKLGQRIGFMGNTGFAIAFSGGDGSHLHFEVREDGVPVNPSIYLP